MLIVQRPKTFEAHPGTSQSATGAAEQDKEWYCRYHCSLTLEIRMAYFVS